MFNFLKVSLFVVCFASIAYAQPPANLGNQATLTVNGSIAVGNHPARNGTWTLDKVDGLPKLGGLLVVGNPKCWSNGTVWVVVGDTSIIAAGRSDPMVVIVWNDTNGTDYIRKCWSSSGYPHNKWDWFAVGANFANATVTIQ